MQNRALDPIAAAAAAAAATVPLLVRSGHSCHGTAAFPVPMSDSACSLRCVKELLLSDRSCLDCCSTTVAAAAVANCKGFRLRVGVVQCIRLTTAVEQDGGNHQCAGICRLLLLQMRHPASCMKVGKL